MSKTFQVKKAVIPAAGLGTRFLPVTKAIPKEMLPIVDRPIIQIIVEELVEAGIKDIIFVVSAYKRPIEDHFHPSFELERKLAEAGKRKVLAEVKRISSLANFIFVRQKEALGTGEAILTARPVVGKEPFLVFWGDDFIVAKPSRARQLLTAFGKYQACILGTVKTKNPEDGGKYGFAVGKRVGKEMVKVERLIEKPGVGKAPSDLATVSGFLFTPEIFPALFKARKKVKGRELTYIDGLNFLPQKNPVYALELKNACYFDTGNKLEYLKAVVCFGLKNKEFGQEFKRFLKGEETKVMVQKHTRKQY